MFLVIVDVHSLYSATTSLISFMFQHTYFYVVINGMGQNVRNIKHKRGLNVCLENKNISKFEFSKIWAATASSVKWPGNMLDNRKIVVRSPGMEGLPLLQSVRICSWTHPASYSMRNGGFFPSRVKRLGHEVNHSPLSCAKINNETSYTSTPPYAFISCRGDFTSLDFKFVVL